jgi:uncharacterized damage-inducible protein DinB
VSGLRANFHAINASIEKRMIARILPRAEAMRDALQRLFRFKAWANDELLTSFAELDQGSPISGLAIKALSQTYVVDRIFIAHMTRKEHAYTSANLSELPTLEDLSADMRKNDQDYIDYVGELDSPQLAEQIDFAFTEASRAACRERKCSCT